MCKNNSATGGVQKEELNMKYTLTINQIDKETNKQVSTFTTMPITLIQCINLIKTLDKQLSKQYNTIAYEINDVNE